MRKEEINRPDTDFVDEDAARAWLSAHGIKLSDKLFDDMIGSGFLEGVRRPNRQTVLIPWKAVVMVLWKIELGILPRETEEEKPGKTRGKSGPTEDS